MPRAEKGTPRKLRIWLEKSKAQATDEIDLTTSTGGEVTTLATWLVSDAMADPTWEAHVFELCQSNTDERGTTTLYTARHRRGDVQRGQYEMRCKANDAEEGSDFDGSPGMLVQGLYRQNERLLNHVLSQTNTAVAPLMKSLEVAQARIATLEAERAKMADDSHKVRTQLFDALDKAKASAGEADEVFEARLMKIGGMLKMFLDK
jgi:hypothetical protein